jgi:hypothetical protein
MLFSRGKHGYSRTGSIAGIDPAKAGAKIEDWQQAI